MKLKELLHNVDYELLKGSLDYKIDDITYDSRTASKNNCFVALVGIDRDGHDYINDVINQGCKCIIVSKNIIIDSSITIIKVKNTRETLPKISSNLFHNPADKLKKIAITGTKGKTTISFMIKEILERTGYKVGVIGTNGTFINGKKYAHKNTTPESYLIQKYMRMMVDENVEYLIMEVSSQALKVGRVSNIIFEYGLFTNLSNDHIGDREHPSYEDYVFSKSKLFRQCKIGILNKDDIEYNNMIKNSTCEIKTIGIKDTNVNISNMKNIEINNTLGMNFDLKGDVTGNYNVSMPGTFSVYNATLAIYLSKLLNIDNKDIINSLNNFRVEGRTEIIKLKNNNYIVIDFAHNELSIKSIINTMKYYSDNITTIIGCGGGRSKSIRKSIGYTSGLLSNLTIITTDNPRNDDINLINEDIEQGVLKASGKYRIIPDRELAIKYAIDNVKENEIILLLGKGHENFQEIKGIKYDFNELEIINKYIKSEKND